MEEKKKRTRTRVETASAKNVKLHHIFRDGTRIDGSLADLPEPIVVPYTLETAGYYELLFSHARERMQREREEQEKQKAGTGN